jgi:16S rRNA (adenine1518-N6/adenine1519-N6)-dimethyltransferase
VARAIGASADDTFLEIGPGRGVLTRPLAAAAGRVVAFEIDRDLARLLREEGLPNVTIVEGDFLRLSLEQLRTTLSAPGGGAPGRLRVAGNLPYNVASPILFKLVELYASGLPLLDAVLMLQREVADRLLASPGSRDFGVLSALIGHRARVERVLSLPPGAFRPAPRVHSTLVRLELHPPEPPACDPALFAALTRALFSRRRKTLSNALLAHPAARRIGPAQLLAESGLDGRRRPETLGIAELVRLADAVAHALRRVALP